MPWPLFNKNRKLIVPPHATFRITQGGEEELQKFLDGDQHAILVALQTNGTSTVDEIAARSGVSRGDVEKAIPALVNKQQVQLISAGGASIPTEE